LIAILQPMLAQLHDQHVVLSGPGTTVRTYVPTDFIDRNEDVCRQYLARANASTRGAAALIVDVRMNPGGNDSLAFITS